MKKTVIVLGTWSSGSGAVSDYLSSRKDFTSPFGTNEFKIISDPMGLHYLFKNFYSSDSLLHPTFAYENFEKYIYKLEKYKIFISPGVKKKLYNKKLIDNTRSFLKKISKLTYYGFPHYKAVTVGLDKKISIRLRAAFSNTNVFHTQKLFPIILPVNKEKFIKEAKKYISNVIKSNSKYRFRNENLVLNNGAEILDPIESSKYYKNPKIICVLRDPRDIFCGMKMRQANSTPSYDVKLFIKWYKHNFTNYKFQKILKDKRILVVKFENFVLNFKRENKRICRFLNIKEKNNFKKNSLNSFDIKFSRSNVYKSKKFLSKNEYQLIKKQLKNYLQW